jgi:hypothetical protein
VLGVHFDAARLAMEGGAMPSTVLQDLKAVRDGLDGGRIIGTRLSQASHAGFAALGTAQLFIPIIGHRQKMCSGVFRSETN